MKAEVLALVEKKEETVGQTTLQTIKLEKELECLSIQARRGVPITSTEENMLIGDVKHNRPLHFTGYIREVEVS